MRKNIYLFVIACLILITGFITAIDKDIAYIVKESPNSFLTNEINSLNLTYDIIFESQVTSTNFSNYEMILVGNDKFLNPNNIPVNNYKSMIINQHHFYKTGILFPNNQWGWSSEKGSQSSPSSLRINDFDISITSGLSKYFTSYSIGDPDVSTYYLKAKKATGIRLLASVDGSSHTNGDSPLSIIYPGAKMLNGNIAQERSLFFGVVEPEYWTTQSKTLFRNSIEWILVGEDRDNDGFFTDDDCNDLDSKVNPNKTEIAYDGIDQDCDGLDLTDVDEDGYDSELVGGLDCNDSNSLFNPGSLDLALNCKNDAPIINTIPNLINYETNLVSVIISASDPENNVLTYSINDSRFSVSGNTLTWQTDYDSEGEYILTVEVTDGDLTSSKYFTLNIREKNRPPLLNVIPDLEWNEDFNFTLNLSEYFYDEDNDFLTFSVASTGNDTNIVLDSLENETATFSVNENWNGEDWIIFRASDGKDDVDSNKVKLKVLPINDIPTLENQIQDLEWDEDASIILDLNNYFKDIDSILTYYFSGNSFVDVSILEGITTITPNENFNGNDFVNFIASDGEFNVTSNNVNLTLIPVNDNPELDNIEDLVVFAGTLIQIIPNASDVDNDSFTFIFTSPLNETGMWQTTEDDIGNYQTTVTVKDSNNASNSQEVNIFVFKKILINEVVSKPNLNESEWIELYNPFEQTLDLRNCNIGITNESIQLNGTINKEEYFIIELEDKLNDNGDTITLNCYNEIVDVITYGSNLGVGHSFGRKPNAMDSDNDSTDFSIFIATTKGISNDEDVTLPVVQLLNPNNNTTFNDTRDINLEFSVSDNMASNLECNLYVNNNLESTKEVSNNSNEEFGINNIVDGVHSWNIICSDGSNSASAPEKFSFTISAPDNPIVNSIEDKTINENQYLSFEVSATDPDNSNLTLSVTILPEGASFLDNGDGTGIFSWKPTYNQSGNYNLEFNVEDSTGLRDSENMKIIVNNVKKPADFSDIQRCSILNENLVVMIKKPDERDEFKIDEEINVDLEIENIYSKDLDIKVGVFLYDIDNEKVVEDLDKDVDVNEGNSEKVELNIEIPDDVENERFAIFVLAEDRSENVCNEAYLEINIERDKDDLIIKKFRLLQEDIKQGKVDLEVLVKNIGSKDQEKVYVIVENDKLGISERSEDFDVEKFGENDDEKIYFSINIPEESEAGEYELKATVFFEGLSNSKTESITVIEKIKNPEIEVISLNSKILNGETLNSNSDSNTGFSTAFIILFLTTIVVIVVLFNIYTLV